MPDDGPDLRQRLADCAESIIEMSKRRDELIRDGIAAGIRVAELAAAAGLSVPRIYQIRDGRR